MGDRRQGSPGYRLQTNVEERVELKTSVDAFATYEFCELPEQPAFDLVPGPAATWKAIWPSLAVVGEPFRLAIVAEDTLGQSDRRTPKLCWRSRRRAAFAACPSAWRSTKATARACLKISSLNAKAISSCRS